MIPRRNSKRKLQDMVKRTPYEMSGSASEIHVHLYIVVQCGLSLVCEDGTMISVVDCVKFSDLVNKCVRPFFLIEISNDTET
jgi:hypothetical protein